MLIKCPECKQTISSTVDACPHCGYKISEEQKKRAIEEAVTVPSKNQTQSDYKSQGSFGAGFAIGFFLSFIGLIIAHAIKQSKTKRGALAGFIVEIGIGLIVLLVFAVIATIKYMR